MKIGVVADTHLKPHMTHLPDRLIQGLKNVDYILHAGDWLDLHVFEMLNHIAPCDGVAGNNDSIEIFRKFGRKNIIELGGCRIGIVHGDGYHSVTEIGARIAFESEKLDIVIFGHSHKPFLQQTSEMLLFNPGSPTDKRRQKDYSYGIIHVNGSRIEAVHHFF